MNAITPIDILDTEPRIFTTDFMGMSGHTSFGWDADSDEWVLPLIAQKLKEGYVFRRVEKTTFAGLPLTRKVKVEKVEDIGDSRTVLIHDKEARKLFEDGRIKLVREREEGSYVAGKIVKDPEEIAKTDTIAHRQAVGG